MDNFFAPSTRDAFVLRVNSLTADSAPMWGQMKVNEMLAHCSLALEFASGLRKPKPTPWVMRWMMRTFFRNVIVGDTPYRPNSPTNPNFLVKQYGDFATEKNRLIKNIQDYSNAGPEKAAERRHNFLGKITSVEWSNAMTKHLDHHLRQFGV